MNANRNARKIALTPAATYLIAMPASYDPARVTADDLANDSAICHAGLELVPLYRATSALWAQAVDTAAIDGGEAHEADMRDSMRQALDAWEDALTACRDGDAPAAVESLTRAAQIAAACGGDDDELRALALFAEGT